MILHRDIKSDNILVDQEGKVWLIDFGLAAYMTDDLLATGSLLYLSPDFLRDISEMSEDTLFPWNAYSKYY